MFLLYDIKNLEDFKEKTKDIDVISEQNEIRHWLSNNFQQDIFEYLLSNFPNFFNSDLCEYLLSYQYESEFFSALLKNNLFDLGDNCPLEVISWNENIEPLKILLENDIITDIEESHLSTLVYNNEVNKIKFLIEQEYISFDEFDDYIMYNSLNERSINVFNFILNHYKAEDFDHWVYEEISYHANEKNIIAFAYFLENNPKELTKFLELLIQDQSDFANLLLKEHNILCQKAINNEFFELATENDSSELVHTLISFENLDVHCNDNSLLLYVTAYPDLFNSFINHGHFSDSEIDLIIIHEFFDYSSDYEIFKILFDFYEQNHSLKYEPEDDIYELFSVVASSNNIDIFKTIYQNSKLPKNAIDIIDEDTLSNARSSYDILYFLLIEENVQSVIDINSEHFSLLDHVASEKIEIVDLVLNLEESELTFDILRNSISRFTSSTLNLFLGDEKINNFGNLQSYLKFSINSNNTDNFYAIYNHKKTELTKEVAYDLLLASGKCSNYNLVEFLLKLPFAKDFDLKDVFTAVCYKYHFNLKLFLLILNDDRLKSIPYSTSRENALNMLSQNQKEYNAYKEDYSTALHLAVKSDKFYCDEGFWGDLLLNLFKAEHHNLFDYVLDKSSLSFDEFTNLFKVFSETPYDNFNKFKSSLISKHDFSLVENNILLLKTILKTNKAHIEEDFVIELFNSFSYDMDLFSELFSMFRSSLIKHNQSSLYKKFFQHVEFSKILQENHSKEYDEFFKEHLTRVSANF